MYTLENENMPQLEETCKGKWVRGMFSQGVTTQVDRLKAEDY
jgi:hypothetical protein